MSELIIKSRSPLAPNAFYTLPLGSIRPTGWLRDQLQIEANGLGGHLDETWADVGSNSGWLGGSGESWERGPYFLDGLLPLAHLLDDDRLKAKAQKFIDWTLTNQAPDGMIDPRTNDDWWPRMVMLKALTQYQEATGDERVIPVEPQIFDLFTRGIPQHSLAATHYWHRLQDDIIDAVNGAALAFSSWEDENLFIELMAYKFILEKWKENPDATKRQIGTWSNWATDDEVNNSALTRSEVEMMKSYVHEICADYLS